LIRARNRFVLQPALRLWRSVWHNLKLLEDHARKRRGRIPAAWSPPLAELREILATSSSEDLWISDEDRSRIERVLSKLVKTVVDMP
jgi:hypothetical protein